MREAEIIYYILKKFSQLKSHDGKFFYSVNKISLKGTKNYPIVLEGVQIKNIEDLKEYFKTKINRGEFLPMSPRRSQLFGPGWDIEILGKRVNGKICNSDQRKFIIEAKGGESNNSNIRNYIVRALGQSLLVHDVKALSNTNICLAFPKSWQEKFKKLVENSKYRQLMKVFRRNRLFYDLEPFLKGKISNSNIEKIKNLIRSALPFATTYLRIFFIDDDGNVEIYGPSAKNLAKILWQRK
ncbi:hypothetical protein LCGC14_1161560 [marine sediment metagenome]|uniref:Uncharacterized protein n=1 Tax=marine sediment metagenome TaxID=412755 RepID=A0A0F9MFF8_9ZZZZ